MLFHLIGRSYQCEITYQLKSQVHFVIKPTKQEKNSTLNKTSIEYHFKDRKEQKSRIGLGPNLNNTNSGQTGVQYLHYSDGNLTFTVYFQIQNGNYLLSYDQSSSRQRAILTIHFLSVKIGLLLLEVIAPFCRLEILEVDFE